MFIAFGIKRLFSYFDFKVGLKNNCFDLINIFLILKIFWCTLYLFNLHWIKNRCCFSTIFAIFQHMHEFHVCHQFARELRAFKIKHHFYFDAPFNFRFKMFSQRERKTQNWNVK